MYLNASSVTEGDMMVKYLFHIMSLIFFKPPENIWKPVAFWCFQGLKKENSTMISVKENLVPSYNGLYYHQNLCKRKH